MNSKESPRLITILCISFLCIFFQYTSSQPIATNLLKANIDDNNDDGNVANSIWIRPLSYLDSDEWNNEDNGSEEFSQLVYNEHDQYNRPSPSSPVRRANFWKRANFWRKRANFWRRNLAA